MSAPRLQSHSGSGEPLPCPVPLQAPMVGDGALSTLLHSGRGVPAWRSCWDITAAHDFWEKATCAASSRTYMGQLNMGVCTGVHHLFLEQPETYLLQGSSWHKALHAHNWKKPWKGLPSEVVETSSGHGRGQPLLADPALSRCVGLGDLQRCLHSTFLWSPLWEPYSCLEGGCLHAFACPGPKNPIRAMFGLEEERISRPPPGSKYITGQSFQFQLF